jgi:hypothetical protein
MCGEGMLVARACAVLLSLSNFWGLNRVVEGDPRSHVNAASSALSYPCTNWCGVCTESDIFIPDGMIPIGCTCGIEEP